MHLCWKFQDIYSLQFIAGWSTFPFVRAHHWLVCKCVCVHVPLSLWVVSYHVAEWCRLRPLWLVLAPGHCTLQPALLLWARPRFPCVRQRLEPYPKTHPSYSSAGPLSLGTHSSILGAPSWEAHCVLRKTKLRVVVHLISGLLHNINREVNPLICVILHSVKKQFVFKKHQVWPLKWPFTVNFP